MVSRGSKDGFSSARPARRGFLGLFQRGGKAAPVQMHKAVEGSRRNDLDARLKEANFPIRSKAALVAALGGPGAKLAIPGRGIMASEEIGDLCFSERDVLMSPEDVAVALESSSWTRAVFRVLHLVWFPIRSPERVSRLVGHIHVRGVPISALAPSLEYPIASAADLVEKLAKARQSYQK